MESEAAVIDAPIDAVEPVDGAPIDGGIEGEQPVPETPEGEQPGVEAPPVEGQEIKPQGLLQKADAVLKQLRATDPKAANELRGALMQSEAIRKEFPGGLKEIRELRQTVQDLGGADGIKGYREKVAEFDSIDQAFTAGDPKFIAKLTETPELQSAFLQHVPAMLSKYAELHPDGYGHHLAEAFHRDMQIHDVRLAIVRLGDFVGDNPQAKEQWQQLADYYNRVNQLSQKKPEAPAKAAAQPAANDELTAARADADKARAEAWGGKADTEQSSIFTTNWDRLTAGKKLSDIDKTNLRELADMRIGKAMAAIPDFQKTCKSYFAAKDQAGYLKYVKAQYEQVVPRVLTALINKGQAAPAVKPGQQPPVAGQKPAAAPAPGFTWTANRPDTEAINWRDSRNTQALIASGKAYLSGGKAVFWKR